MTGPRQAIRNPPVLPPLLPAVAAATKAPPAVLPHSPMKSVSALITKEQVSSETLKNSLLATLASVWKAATVLTRVRVCLRCSLRGLNDEHGWGECGAMGKKEVMWKEENPGTGIRDWALDCIVPHLDEVPDDDTCCKVCLFARQDKRFHDLDEERCLFPVLVGQICYVGYFYGGVREELCRLVGHKELGGSGDLFVKWAAEAVGGDHRWVKGATKLVWCAFEIMKRKSR